MGSRRVCHITPILITIAVGIVAGHNYRTRMEGLRVEDVDGLPPTTQSEISQSG